MKAVNGLGKRAQCNARSAPLGKSLSCISCLCFDCSASLKIAQLPRLLLWMFWDTTGWVGSSPAIYNGHRLNIILSAKHSLPVGTQQCRPAKSSCKNWFDSSRGQNMALQCISSNVCTNHTSYHIYDSKGYGLRFSDHQSRTSLHDGSKKSSVLLDMECNAYNQTN